MSYHQCCQEAFVSLDGNDFVEQGTIPLSKSQQNISKVLSVATHLSFNV